MVSTWCLAFVSFCSLIIPHPPPAFQRDGFSLLPLIPETYSPIKTYRWPLCGCHHPPGRMAKSHNIQDLDANGRMNWLKERPLSDSKYWGSEL